MVTPNDVLPPPLDEIRSRVAPFCQRHGVARLEVFGSLARGEPHLGSGVDLLIIFRPEVHLVWDFFELHQEAVRLFLEEAEKMGTLEQILEEAGYGKRKHKFARPNFISVQRVTLPLPMTHAKA
ncbi:MAG TPA: nucleotidyltransferase domain-containing protein [Bryobacteraceae bacterium]|jgi:predicted nucleotidyltransferase